MDLIANYLCFKLCKIWPHYEERHADFIHAHEYLLRVFLTDHTLCFLVLANGTIQHLDG